MASALATPFYIELGFTRTEIGLVAKNAGLWASILGGILGAYWMLKTGVNKYKLINKRNAEKSFTDISNDKLIAKTLSKTPNEIMSPISLVLLNRRKRPGKISINPINRL